MYALMEALAAEAARPRIPRWTIGLQLCAVVLVAALAVVDRAQRWNAGILLTLTAFAVISDLTGVETASSKLRVSGSFLALVLAIVLLGGAPASIVGIATIAIGWFRWREAPHYLRNNLVTYALFPLLAGIAFHSAAAALDAGAGTSTWYVLVAGAFALALTLNFTLIAGYQCVLDGSSLRSKAREALAPLIASELASALLAVMSAFTFERLGVAGLVLIGVTLVVFQRLVGQLLLSQQRGAELERRAVTDELTGLPNAAFFRQRVDEELAAGPRGVAVMVMDLDRFKEINDTLGHHYGDRVLQAVAERILESLQGEAELVTRLGGDEFAVFVPEQGRAPALANRLRDVLTQPCRVEEMELEVGLSIGIARYPQHGDSAAALLRQADVAMYSAKEGQTGVEVYTPKRDRNTTARLSLVGDLRRAIAAGDLYLQYQPKVDLRTRSVGAVEALARWEHPVLGPQSPIEFIGLAEQTGLIRPLTRSVLERALTQARAWRDRGLDVSVAVNLSPRALSDPHLADQVAAQLAAARLGADALVLEITEGTLIHDPVRAMETIQALHDMGVELSIDDFGTGYSSLAYLKRLPIDELKVDRSFVANLVTDSSDAVIVRSTIELAHNLGLRTVAEGVEDAATLEHLADLGCDLVQGYHLSRPLMPDALERWAGAIDLATVA
jgi:diguanylate cyclase (GGDEF)-like protein